MKVSANLTIALTAVVSLAFGGSTQAADLIVTANDAKFHRVAGHGTYPKGNWADTLTLLDATVLPPKVITTVQVQHTIHGPPQSVAITPNGKLAFVSAPDDYDYKAEMQSLYNFVQVIDLSQNPAVIVDRIDVGAHPQGLSVSPDGSMVLAALVDGRVAVLSIDDINVSLAQHVEVSSGRLAGVSFTHDGTTAIVANRVDQGLSVLAIEGGEVVFTGELIASGVSPYAVDVSSDGRWAVVSNVGLAAIEGRPGAIYGDADSITLIDTSKRPYRAVQHLTVPAIPEGVAISPDGRWIAVQSMAGSTLPPSNPGHTEYGTLSLFEIRDGRAELVAETQSGVASQGVVFTSDSRHVLLQMNVEKAIAVYAAGPNGLKDTGHRVELLGGPTSIRSQPR